VPPEILGNGVVSIEGGAFFADNGAESFPGDSLALFISANGPIYVHIISE